MAQRFPRGSIVYDKQGRSYVVEETDGGMVYCSADNGAEVEFPENALTPQPPAAAARREVSYQHLAQSRHYLAPKDKLDKAACKTLLDKVERLAPGVLDFAAYTTAAHVLTDAHEAGQVPFLSIPKCRAVFEAAPIEARAACVATLLGTPPTVLVGMAHTGEFLMRAMLDKGLSAHANSGGEDFGTFRNRPRK